MWLASHTPDFFRGRVSERSLASSYTYTRIDARFARAAQVVLGLRFPGTAWARADVLPAVIEQYWLGKNTA